MKQPEDLSPKELVELAKNLQTKLSDAQAKLAKRSGLNRPFTTEFGEYKGHKILKIKGPMTPLNIGKTKAKAIMAVLSTIKEFAESPDISTSQQEETI